MLLSCFKVALLCTTSWVAIPLALSPDESSSSCYSRTIANRLPQTDGSKIWRQRVDNLLDSLLENFFPGDIAFEVPCEGRKGACSTDMLSFKGYVHRWLSVVTQVAPHTKVKILPVLKTSTQAAIRQCTGGKSGRVCGFYWSSGKFFDPSVDATSGAGEAMNVLAAVSSLLIEDAEPPVTNSTGGISEGNPDAGKDSQDVPRLRPITTADRIGAAFLTLVVLGVTGGTFIWMCLDWAVLDFWYEYTLNKRRNEDCFVFVGKCFSILSWNNFSQTPSL